MELRERIMGCLYGGAAGDALGYSVEFMGLKEIRGEYGAAGIQDYDTRRRGKALVTDDTQMTLFTAEGMVLAEERGLSGVRSIYRSYLDWLKTQSFGDRKETGDSWLLRHEALWAHRAPGNTCLSSLQSGTMGLISRPINRSKGCGGIMRTSVCGFAAPSMVGDGQQDRAALFLGAQAAAITHSHPMGWIPAAVLAQMVYLISYGGMGDIAAAARLATTAALREWGDAEEADRLADKVEDAIFAAKTSDRPDPETIEALEASDRRAHGGGWLGDDALAIAVYAAVRYENDFPGCIRAAVNHSGDSDSTGQMAGALVGARIGASAIGAEWKDALDVQAAIEETGERLLAAARPLA